MALRCQLTAIAAQIFTRLILTGGTGFGNGKAVKKCLADKQLALPGREDGWSAVFSPLLAMTSLPVKASCCARRDMIAGAIVVFDSAWVKP